MRQQGAFDAFANAEIGCELMGILSDVLGRACRENTAVVFAGRHSYWIYRLFRMYSEKWKPEYENLMFLCWEYANGGCPEKLDGRREILVFDCTLEIGRTLFNTYKAISESCPEAEILPVAAYSMLSKNKLRDTMAEWYCDGVGKPELLEGFLDVLDIYHQAAPGAVGWISSQEALMFYEELVPYSTEYPIIADAATQDTPAVRLGYPYAVHVSKTRFENLCSVYGKWEYFDSSYKWPDCLGASWREAYINSGFFLFHGSPVGPLRDSIALVVKCNHKYLSDGEVAAVFTSLAVIGSMGLDDAWNLFHRLYQGTAYFSRNEKLYQEWKGGCREAAEQLGKAIFRAVEYALSLYAYREFAALAEPYLSIKLQLDASLMAENFSDGFTEAAKEISKWEPWDFQNRLADINPPRPIPARHPFASESFRHVGNGIQGLLGQIRLGLLKRKNAGGPFLQTEELKGFVFSKLNGYLTLPRAEPVGFHGVSGRVWTGFSSSATQNMARLCPYDKRAKLLYKLHHKSGATVYPDCVVPDQGRGLHCFPEGKPTVILQAEPDGRSVKRPVLYNSSI